MSASDPKSVTRMIEGIKSPTPWTFKKAASEVYQRYATQLLPVVRREMTQRLRVRLDAEEVVNSAMNSFYRRHRDGQYHVPDRESFWNLLVGIARNKTRNQAKFHRRKKRDYQRELPTDGGDDRPSPQFEAKGKPDAGSSPIGSLMADEEMDQMIGGLAEHLRPVALLLLAGHDAADMAEKFGCSQRTIERRIRELGRLLTRQTSQSGTNP